MKRIETHTETKNGFVHSRIDGNIKEQASFILEKIGLNVSDAIRLFLNQVVMRKGMPFRPSATERAARHQPGQLIYRPLM